MDKPLLTISIICYNQQKEVDLIFRSLIWQYENIFHDFEVIVCDDGSNPKTKIPKCPFPIKYMWQEDLGIRISLARNKTIFSASGKYIMFLDGDTFIGEKSITPYLSRLQENLSFYGLRYKVNRRILNDKKEFSQNLIDWYVIDKDWRAKELPDLPNKDYKEDEEIYKTFDLGNNIFPLKLMKQHLFPTDLLGYGGDMPIFILSYLCQVSEIKAVNESITYHINHSPHPPASFYDYCKSKLVMDYAIPKLKHIIKEKEELKLKKLGL